MAERRRGLYRLLSFATVYMAVQRIVGSHKIRERLVRLMAVRPGDRVLDIGCGPATILRYLTDVQYIGYEPNPAYIETARQEFGDRGEFHVGYFDDAAAAVTPRVDIVLVKAVLHHLSDAEADDLFRLLARVLAPGGRVVTLDNVFVTGQNVLARTLISMDRGRNVRSPEGYVGLARPHFAQVAGKVVHKSFIPYTYWFMTATAPLPATK